MKEITIKKESSRILGKVKKGFKSFGKKIMSIDLIDGQGRWVSMARRLLSTKNIFIA